MTKFKDDEPAAPSKSAVVWRVRRCRSAARPRLTKGTSTRRPASVIRTRAISIARPPATTRSACAVASPDRTNSTNRSMVKPWYISEFARLLRSWPLAELKVGRPLHGGSRTFRPDAPRSCVCPPRVIAGELRSRHSSRRLRRTSSGSGVRLKTSGSRTFVFIRSPTPMARWGRSEPKGA